jgi:hypothetical protein
VKPFREELVVDKDTRGAGVFEDANGVKHVRWLAESAPSVNQQRDTYDLSDVASGPGQVVKTQCRSDLAGYNASSVASEFDVPKSNRLGDFG